MKRPSGREASPGGDNPMWEEASMLHLEMTEPPTPEPAPDDGDDDGDE